VPHAWPAFLLDEQKQGLRDALARHNLAISNINSFMMHAVNDARQRYWHPSWIEPDRHYRMMHAVNDARQRYWHPSWIEPDRHYRQVRIDHTKRALTLARELGAPNITTEPGGPLEPGQKWSDALALFVEMLKPVVEHAEREGVMLLVEPEPGLLIERSDQFEELMKHLGSPAVGLNFDIGHSYCVGEDPEAVIPRLAPYIRHFHLEDIAATRVHHHLVPGDGAIDFAATLKAIRGMNYTGWITIELYPYVDDPDAAARRALEHVNAILKTL
jgi:sugar phosphate isomerase/epimerase